MSHPYRNRTLICTYTLWLVLFPSSTREVSQVWPTVVLFEVQSKVVPALPTLLSVVPSKQAVLWHVDQLFFPASSSWSNLQTLYWLSYILHLITLKPMNSITVLSSFPYIADFLLGNINGSLTMKLTDVIATCCDQAALPTFGVSCWGS